MFRKPKRPDSSKIRFYFRRKKWAIKEEGQEKAENKKSVVTGRQDSRQKAKL